MAIHLQDPFENRPTDTPMTTISNAIEKNLVQMVNEFRDEFDDYDEKLEPVLHHIQPVKIPILCYKVCDYVVKPAF